MIGKRAGRRPVTNAGALITAFRPSTTTQVYSSRKVTNMHMNHERTMLWRWAKVDMIAVGICAGGFLVVVRPRMTPRINCHGANCAS